MKILALAAVVVAGLTTNALAADPVLADRNGAYVGGYLGASTENQSKTDIGLNGGYQIAPFVRLEADYDHAWFTSGQGNAITAQAIGQYRIPNSTVTPYVLAGTGMGFGNNGNAGIYNVGAGMRVAFSQSVEADFRYRYIAPFNSSNNVTNYQNVFTAGLNYRF